LDNVNLVEHLSAHIAPVDDLFNDKEDAANNRASTAQHRRLRAPEQIGVGVFSIKRIKRRLKWNRGGRSPRPPLSALPAVAPTKLACSVLN
jgi:hypothetical protein